LEFSHDVLLTKASLKGSPDLSLWRTCFHLLIRNRKNGNVILQKECGLGRVAH
jgi:hypothetical protein